MSSQPDVSVLIPVERGREWNKERATRLPHGTRYCVAKHDAGDWAEAVNDAVKAAETEFCILSAPDVWFEHNPDCVQFLTELCWDADLTWGPLIVHDKDGTPQVAKYEGVFCPNRLTLENYVSPVFCFRRSKFLEAGGMRSGPWEFQNRLLRAGGRFKYVPEAMTARDEPYEDPSPKPTPVDVKATFYHQATVGTTYWRCQLPARHLPGQTVFNIPLLGEQDGEAVMVNHAGAAVFQYVGDSVHHVLTRFMQERDVRVLVEVDDDYTHWYKGVMRKAGWWERVSDCPARGGYSVEGHRATVEIADGVIVTTERLAKQYRKLNKNVFVCPNQIDPDDWPELKKPDDGKFRIGWFASASHQGDGTIIRRALEWASAQPDVEVVMIGVGVVGGKPWFDFPFTFYPWSNDLGVYRRFLLNLDVGLAPVTANPWALCRSDLKALEYAMAGALPVVSDVAPYEGCDVPGIVHCPNPKSFLDAVRWTVENRDEVRALALEARDYVLAERTVKKNIHLWEQACV